MAEHMLDVEVTLIGDGATTWIAEVQIPSVGYRDTIEFAGYTDEDEAYNAAALMAIYRWRKNVGDLNTPLTVTRIEPAQAEEA